VKQTDLLQPTPAEPAPNTPEGFASREPDDFDRVAHTLFGVPASMRWIEVETLGDGKAPRALTSFRIRMAEPPTATYQSGPRKGRINWRKRDKTLDREVVLSFAQFDKFLTENGSTFRETLGKREAAP
jgi:hypothetical protein